MLPTQYGCFGYKLSYILVGIYMGVCWHGQIKFHNLQSTTSYQSDAKHWRELKLFYIKNLLIDNNIRMYRRWTYNN